MRVETEDGKDMGSDLTHESYLLSDSISLCKTSTDDARLKKHLYDVCQRSICEELRLDQVIPALREVTVCMAGKRLE